MRVTNAPESERETLLQIVQDPRNVYTTAPQSTEKFADFLSKTGFLESRPTSWKDYFFEGIHGASGS
jgi:NitT/TauT family transport system substrate-binding protein